MKTLGVIGGLGPESTIDYYEKIIALYRERTRDGSYPRFFIISVDLKKGLDFMEAGAPIPLISIVEATCAAVKALGLKRLALFGTRYTMQATFYLKVFARDGIELLVPEANDQDYIHHKYMNELVPGKFLPETRSGLLAIVDRMKAKSDIEGVILAGTELPLILRDADHNGIPFLNTTRIHVEAAVTEMLS